MTSLCLPGLPAPNYGESFNGYQLRLSELNGYDNLAFMHKIAGYNGMPLAFRPENIPPIARLIDMSEDDVLQMTYERGSTVTKRKQLSFLGHDTFHYLVDIKHPKICPACIRETGYVHALWDLTPVVACPKHRRMLLDRCPKCKEPLSWRRQGPLTCSCGASLIRAEAPPASKELRALMAIIAAAAGVGASPIRLPSRMPRPLLQMPLGELLHCVAWFGWWNSGHAQETLRRLRMLLPSERIPIIEASVPVLVNWPSGLEDFLGRMRGQAPRVSRNPVAREYGKLYAFLFYGTVPPGREFIRESALQWLRSTPQGAGLSAMAGKSQRRRLATPEQVTFRRFANLGRQLGIGPRAAQRTLLGGGIKPPKKSSLVPDEITAELRERTADLMLYRDAARLLGVSYNLFIRMLRDRVIPSDDSICTRATRTFGSVHRRDILDILSSIGRVALKPRRAQDFEILRTLSDALQTKTSIFFTRRDLLAAIVDGRVKCYGDGKPGAFSRLLVDIRAVRAAGISAMIGQDSDLILLSDAAKSLSVRLETVRKLVRKGKVRGHLVDTGAHKYWLISESDLQRCWEARGVPYSASCPATTASV